MQSDLLTGLTCMTRIRLVEYTTHPEHTAANRERIQSVIAQLHELSPEGFSYTVVLTPETNTFRHLVISEGQSNPLEDLPAFAEFQQGLKDRVSAAPHNREAEIVGSYQPASSLEGSTR